MFSAKLIYFCRFGEAGDNTIKYKAEEVNIIMKEYKKILVCEICKFKK